MDIVRRILACETIDELTVLEGLYVLNEYEQRLVYERRIEIVSRLLEWGTENEQQGVVNSEPVVQSGRGEKRSADESGEGTSNRLARVIILPL